MVELTQQHVDLVHLVARRVRAPRWIHHDELVGWGMLGLVGAARRYDPCKGLPFKNYAVLRVRGAILDGLRAWDHLSRAQRREADPPLQPASLDAERSGGLPLPEVLPDQHLPPLDDMAARRDLIDRVVAATLQLTPNQRFVIHCLYDQDMTHRAISEVMGIPASRVSELHGAAITRLAYILRERGYVAAAA